MDICSSPEKLHSLTSVPEAYQTRPSNSQEEKKPNSYYTFLSYQIVATNLMPTKIPNLVCDKRETLFR